ncbi:hypothetical protein, partial [Salinisphaera sp.]|uniref:hypothetical protein n=1 Tax=Salinisphaera sp. TaxID=1914330 RepID=UPI002D7925D8
AELGKLGYARVGYNSNLPFTGDHPIDGPEHNQSIGVLQRFNADRDFDADNPRKSGKIKRLRTALKAQFGAKADITEFEKSQSATARIDYLGNLTEADLKKAGLYYHDPDDGGKTKPALLLPCGSYKTKSACNTQ